MKNYFVVLKNLIECSEVKYEFSSYAEACQAAREIEKALLEFWEKDVDFTIEVLF